MADLTNFFEEERIPSRPIGGGVNPNMFSNPEDLQEIMKGDISYAMEYDNAMKFQKKGSEIKVGLTKRKQYYEGVKSECMQKAAILRQEIAKECNELPTEDVYIGSEFRDHVDMTSMKVYSYSQRNKCAPISNDMMTELDVTSKELPSLMNQHNEYMRRCSDACKDLVTIDSLMNNLKDNSSYNLNTRQLLAFGL